MIIDGRQANPCKPRSSGRVGPAEARSILDRRLLTFGPELPLAMVDVSKRTAVIFVDKVQSWPLPAHLGYGDVSKQCL